MFRKKKDFLEDWLGTTFLQNLSFALWSDLENCPNMSVAQNPTQLLRSG